MVQIGIDLGGTKIEGIAVEANGNELIRRRIKTPIDDYKLILESIANLVVSIESEIGQTGSVGVGVPGSLSKVTQKIKNANSTCLIGQALHLDLQQILKRPIRIANDANCFAISEAKDGAGKSYDFVFGVILGTGVGGGIVTKGSIHEGINSIGGEWGHNPIPWPTKSETSKRACYCGKFDCIETFLSGPGLEYDHLTVTGDNLTAVEIVERSENKFVDAMETMNRYEHRLAKALASVINVLDPDIIILGGGLSNIDRLYSSIPTLWQPWVFSDKTLTPLKKNKHGDSSGVRGAAWLCSI